MARENWQLFATENYFNENGFFVAVMVGFPLLVLAVAALVNLLIGTARLAVRVKRLQLRSQHTAAAGSADAQQHKKKK